MPDAPAKAYSYTRFSTPEQKLGASLVRQIERSRAWAAARGVELVEELKDEGISAFRGKNRHDGALSLFLHAAKNGEIAPGSFLIVESLDRLSRDAIFNSIRLLVEILEYGITIVTLSDNQEYSRDSVSNDASKLIISLTVFARANEESRIKSNRVSDSWKRKREAAEKNGTLLTKKLPGWLTVSEGVIVPIAERVEVVREIFELAAAGFGRRLIASTLNQRGVRPFRGRNGWHDSSVAKILESEAPVGIFQPHKIESGKRVKEGRALADYFPKIIDEELYWRAQAVLNSRRKSSQSGGRKGQNIANLVSRVAICGACGSSMIRQNKGVKKGGHPALVCSNAQRHGGCDFKTRIRYDAVEEWVLSCLLSDPNFGADLSAKRSALAHATAARSAKEGELSAAEDKLRALSDLLDTSEASRAYGKLIIEAEANVARLEKELDDAQENETRLQAEMLSQDARVSELRDQLAGATGEELALLRSKIAHEIRQRVKRLEFFERLCIVYIEIKFQDSRYGGFMGRRTRYAKVETSANTTSVIDIDADEIFTQHSDTNVCHGDA